MPFDSALSSQVRLRDRQYQFMVDILLPWLRSVDSGALDYAGCEALPLLVRYTYRGYIREEEITQGRTRTGVDARAVLE